jgi:hypothetical protein
MDYPHNNPYALISISLDSPHCHVRVDGRFLAFGLVAMDQGCGR